MHLLPSLLILPRLVAQRYQQQQQHSYAAYGQQQQPHGAAGYGYAAYGQHQQHQQQWAAYHQQQGYTEAGVADGAPAQAPAAAAEDPALAAFRQVDWTCPTCHNSNFASRTVR